MASNAPKRQHVTRIKAPPADRSRALDFDTLLVENARRLVSFRRYMIEMWERRSLVRVLAGRQLKGTYEMNVVGFAWWLMEPLSLAAVYYVLVKILQRNTPTSFVVFILASLIPFKWLMSSLLGSMATVRQNASLVTDVYFPRALLPVTETVIGLAHFGVGMLVVPLFMLGLGVRFSPTLIWIPVAAAVQFVFVLGLSYPFSVWGLNYRNLPGLMGNILRLWFYLTPALWQISRVSNKKFLLIIHLNPLTGIFRAYQGAIYNHHKPGMDLAWSAFVGVAFLALGSWYFTRREAQFGKVL
jgi:ABC-type polysaccharide/polyol phosphate export permease